LEADLEHNPVACQMRRSLINYMNSSTFKPTVSLTAAQVRGLHSN